MTAPESLAVPPKDPFRTRRQLPRTPLSSKSGNRSRLPGSRARSASPGLTKIPRSSHIRRSESPARAAAGLGTPSGRSSAAAAGQAAVESASENVSTAGTTPVADTRRVEEEILAAFARTPKVVRTPPKGSAPSGTSGGAAAFPAREKPAGKRSAAKLPALPSAGAAPAPAGEVPPPRRAADPPAEQVFGKRAKLSRTSPRSGEAAGLGATAGRTTEGSKPPPPPPPPQQQQQQQQQQRRQGLVFPQAAAHASASATVARSVQQLTTHAGGGAIGSPSRLASPSVSADTDSSCTNAANVRSLLGSDSKTADVAGSTARGGGAGGALTPAAFEGLISAMRTPSTGMKRRNALVNEVPQMKSLDAVKVATANRPANAPRGQVPPRATTWAGSARSRYASSVEEAKAAAEAAAKATAEKKALAAAAAATAAAATAAPAAAPSAEPPAAPADDVRSPPASLRPASESAPAAASAGGVPAPAGESDVGMSGSVPRGQEEAAARPSPPAVEREHEAPAAAHGPGTIGGEEEELTVDPFVRSQKLPRTPTPATVAHVQATTTTLTVEAPAPSPRHSAGGNSGADVVLHPESQPEAVTSVPPQGEKEGGREGAPGAVAVADPFASRSNIPRTPTNQVVPPQPSSFQEGVGDGGGGGGGGDVEAMDLEGARVQIRELNQELACKRDSLAKQAEERKRLADAAFEAQDEAAKLRQRLQEIQAQIQEQQHLGEGAGPAEGSSKGKGKDSGDGDGNRPADGGDGGELEHPNCEEGEAGRAGAGAGVGPVGLTAERVVQLEIEKWETEKGKLSAEKEAQRAAEAARQAKVALDEAQTKVVELTISAEARHEEMLAERLRRNREQCKQDERAMEEHQIKVKLFVADKRAEMLRAQVSEKKRLKAEQCVRAAAVAVAGKACKVVQEFVARNARMSRRVAGLRANVEEREELVSKLKERSALLEASGRSAQHETGEVRDLLAAATLELEAAKRSSEALEARLGPLERECREAQTAQENLRVLVDAEEARRVSVEQRLSEVKRSGENVVGIERARRQSTERRLGLAERTRDELAAAAGTALREAAEVERSRRMSVERRLEYAERARTELSATAAESAASAAAAAASAAAASTAASEAAALSRSKGPAVASPSGATPPPPAAPAPAPKKKKKVVEAAAAVNKSSKKAESAAVDDAAASGGGVVVASPTPKRATKRARAAEDDIGDGNDAQGDESPPAKVTQRRKPSPPEKRAQTAVRAKPSGTKKATAAAATAAAAAGNGGSSSPSDSDSDSDFDGSANPAAVPPRTEAAPAIATGRTGRKRKQINYAEPSPLLLGRSIIAALSDSSDDEYNPPAPRSKKPARVVAAGRKKPRAAAATGVAGASAAPAAEAASSSTVQSGTENGEHEDEDEEAAASANATETYKGKGKGKGKAKSSSSVPAAAKDGGRSAAAAAAATPRESGPKKTNGGEKSAASTAETAEAAVVENPEKKRRRSTAAAKKGKNTPAGAAAAKTDGGGSVPATSSQGSKKAGRKSVGRASKAKAVQKPEQGASVPIPVLEGGGVEAAGTAASAGDGLLSTDLSPIAPPHKHSRKLLGGETSRYKTPKPKKAAAAASRADGGDDDENTKLPPTAAAAAAAASAAGAVPPTKVGVTGVVAGVGPKSGSSATAAKKAPSLAPASREGGAAGSGGGGAAAAAAKPAVKPLKLSTNSILAMRGKSTMRTTLFKGFLDPKNGFKVPKLKAGAPRR